MFISFGALCIWVLWGLRGILYNVLASWLTWRKRRNSVKTYKWLLNNKQFEIWDDYVESVTWARQFDQTALLFTRAFSK